MFSKTILFTSLFLAALPLFAKTPEQELQRLSLRQRAAQALAWEDPYWRKLLYYEKSLLGRWHSPSVNPEFFLAKWGRINPRLELEAAVDGLYYEGADDGSPECRFPERYRWLREKLSVNPEALPPPRLPFFRGVEGRDRPGIGKPALRGRLP